ncbi:hypothetical protein Pint_21058 [Pistacia integerrima]|uniref:Uncharacterized protein n=1 Tax=Pistacia integerrima TaxID=434235 RepID=A0ACC0XC21_9ROSI|nr:hypothetical protein Pint_21058 [Pistacia integerrima]
MITLIWLSMLATGTLFAESLASSIALLLTMAKPHCLYVNLISF